MITKMVHPGEYLESHGIKFLTREACGLGMRTLCDVEEEGQRILDEYWGGVCFTSPGANSSTAVGVMLPIENVRRLAAFTAIYADNASAVIDVYHMGETYSADHLTLVFDEPGTDFYGELRELIDRYSKYHKGHFMVWQPSTAPGNGVRNKHMFTGRMR